MEKIERIIPKSYFAYLDKNRLSPEESKVYQQSLEKDESDDDDDNQQSNPPVVVILNNPHTNPTFSNPVSVPQLPVELKVDDDYKNTVNDDKFWQIVALLGWRCKSEGEAKIHHITRNLKPDEIAYLKAHIDTYAQHVENGIKKYGWLSKASIDQVKNFTYHVVGMGQQMYLNSIGEPEFIQFMWDSQPPEYQNLYDMLNSL